MRSVFLFVLVLVPAALAQDPATASTREVAPVVQKHCAECHEGEAAEKGFRIDGMTAEAAVLALSRIRSRTMPPPDAEMQLDATSRRALVEALCVLVPSEPGERLARPRRLSREAYVRTVRDLCGVDFASRDALPEDVRVHGFDDLGDGPGVAAADFEAWFDAATSIAERMRSLEPQPAIVDPAADFDAALRAFLRRALRRPPADDEVAARVALRERVLAGGGDEGLARTAVVRSVLASPAFLLRTEFGEIDQPNRRTSHEFAVQLSYLLTSSMPDDELAAAADRGELRNAVSLQAHARRLLAKEGGRAFGARFVAQWLRAVDVLAQNADFRRYPEIWNHGLRPAFLEEIVQLCAEIARENGSVLWLVDCDHAWLDARLAAHYGLPKPDGEGFVRVPLPDRRRGGVLGSGAMAMVSSFPLRTSPVLRGRYVLEHLLDANVPPPPPGAGSLPADDAPIEGASLRTQLERHRRDAKCASCHAAMDPLGFALESYDVLGRVRTEVHGQPVDQKGELPDGTSLDGPIALKDELLRREDEFVHAFASRLATFAIGRAMVPADEPELLRIVDACRAGQNRFLSLLDALLASPLFLLRDASLPLRESGGPR